MLKDDEIDFKLTVTPNVKSTSQLNLSKMLSTNSIINNNEDINLLKENVLVSNKYDEFEKLIKEVNIDEILQDRNYQNENEHENTTINIHNKSNNKKRNSEKILLINSSNNSDDSNKSKNEQNLSNKNGNKTKLDNGNSSQLQLKENNINRISNYNKFYKSEDENQKENLFNFESPNKFNFDFEKDGTNKSNKKMNEQFIKNISKSRNKSSCKKEKIKIDQEIENDVIRNEKNKDQGIENNKNELIKKIDFSRYNSDDKSEVTDDSNNTFHKENKNNKFILNTIKEQSEVDIDLSKGKYNTSNFKETESQERKNTSGNLSITLSKLDKSKNTPLRKSTIKNLEKRESTFKKVSFKLDPFSAKKLYKKGSESSQSKKSFISEEMDKVDEIGLETYNLNEIENAKKLEKSTTLKSSKSNFSTNSDQQYVNSDSDIDETGTNTGTQSKLKVALEKVNKCAKVSNFFRKNQLQISHQDRKINRRSSKFLQHILLLAENHHKTNLEMLIDEISKPKMDPSQNKQLFFTEFRNISLIVSKLIKIRGFEKLTKFFHFDEHIIKDLAHYITLETVQPGSYIYKQGQKSTAMYIVLDGEIELGEFKYIKNSNSNANKNQMKNKNKITDLNFDEDELNHKKNSDMVFEKFTEEIYYKERNKSVAKQSLKNLTQFDINQNNNKEEEKRSVSVSNNIKKKTVKFNFAQKLKQMKKIASNLICGVLFESDIKSKDLNLELMNQRSLLEGELFGEMNLIKKTKRNENAIAKKLSHLLVIDKMTYDKVLMVRIIFNIETYTKM